MRRKRGRPRGSGIDALYFPLLDRFHALKGTGMSGRALVRDAEWWSGYSGRQVERFLSSHRQRVRRLNEIFAGQKVESLELPPGYYQGLDPSEIGD